MFRKLLIMFGIGILLLSVGMSAAAGKSYRAERFDAAWQINADGSLSVVETVVFNLSGGPFTYVYRELRSDKSDGVEVLAASMDGQPMTVGKGAGQYEVTGRGTQKVTWHFEAATDSTHTFELRYRVLGAVRKDGHDDLLYWNFLPTDYEYTIDSATLVVSYPATAVRIGKAEFSRTNSSILEQDGQVKFMALDISKGAHATAALRFAGGSLIAQPPTWQQHAADVARRAPTLGLAAAFVLALGAVLLTTAWRRGSRSAGALVEPRAMLRSAPPSNLPPALAGALVGFGGKAGLVQAMATLFRLAQYGVIVFEEVADKKWYRGPQFVVRFQPRALDAVRLDPHEETLIDGLFTDKGRDEIPLAELGRRLSKVVRPFAQAVEAELAARRLLDGDRVRYGGRFTRLGVVLILSLAPALIVAAFLFATYGGWVFLVPAALLLLSLVAFFMGSAYSVRSAAGEEEADAWRGFREYIKGVVKGREPSWDVRLFDRYFPYAAAFDVAEGWAKAFRERGGGEVPGWFRSLSAASADRMGAFVAMTAASHASTSTGGGGAGGAGGGGGSGAG